jgi:hypothetical protein
LAENDLENEEEKRFMTLLNEELANEFPNPGRVGCPDSEFLKRLAKHQVPISEVDPWLAHLGSCSRCYENFNRLRFAIKEQRRRRLTLWGALACVVLASAGLLWMRAGGRREVSAPGVTMSPMHPTVVTVDRTQGREVASAAKDGKPLEVTLDITASQTRGEKVAKDVPTIRIPARRLACHMTLPLGSADGLYYVRIQHAAQGQAVAAAQGNATIKDGDFRLDVELDLSSVPTGEYLLSYRHAGESWHKIRILITG